MRNVLVTGASRGIGYAIANVLLACGHNVIGSSRNPQLMKITDPSFTAVHLDLSQISTQQTVLQDFASQCADIDTLILNAGVGRFGGLEEFSHSQIENLMTINLIAQIQLVRALIVKLKQRGWGNIIFIGSESALTTGKQGSIYSAAKFGLRGFSQALRRECANSGVKVGIINPGAVNTPFFDELSFKPGADEANSILPEQVADAVVLMLNSESNVVYDEINLSPLKKVIVKKARH